MGKVIQIRKTSVKQDVVEYFERMLARAKCGRVQGHWGVNDMDGKQSSSAVGTFAIDTAFAALIVSQGLDVLMKKVGESPIADTLPHLLRTL